ncbi:MAG: hypothetical protein HY586_05505 [Candidatus Omnitrophica bacterium]|nr:hypothetical protein [Candidatus Omnitrophota bacterium]
MNFLKSPAGKLVIGIIFIAVGILVKRILGWEASAVMGFHLTGGIFLIWGLIAWAAKK